MTTLLDTFLAAAERQRITTHVCDDWPAALQLVRELVGDEPALVDGDPELAGLGLRAAADAWSPVWGVSLADAAAAESATLLVTSGPGRRRATGMNPLHHVVITRADDLVPTYPDLVTALAARAEIPALVRFTTGPSRSGDIELKTIYGMHGPASLTVIVLSTTSAP